MLSIYLVRISFVVFFLQKYLRSLNGEIGGCIFENKNVFVVVGKEMGNGTVS